MKVKLAITSLVFALAGCQTTTVNHTESIDTGSWTKDKNGLYNAQSLDDDTFILIGPGSNKESNVYFVIGNEGCKKFSKTPRSFDPISVNGQYIRASSQCLGGGRMAVFAQASEGEEFIIDELKYKDLIYVGYSEFASRYSVKGFSAAWEDSKQYDGAL